MALEMVVRWSQIGTTMVVTKKKNILVYIFLNIMKGEGKDFHIELIQFQKYLFTGI